MERMGLTRKNVGLGLLLAAAVALAWTAPTMASEPTMMHSSEGGFPYTLPDADVCLSQGGQPQGAGTDCYPNPCTPVRTEQTTWGSLKVSYR